MLPGIAAAEPNRDPLLLTKHVGKTVFVQNRTDEELKGRLISVSRDLLIMSDGLGERALSWLEVKKVFLLGDRAADGFGKGAAVGLGLGIFGTQGLSCSDCPGRVAVGLIGAMAFYGAIGAWIDHRHVGRTLIYAAP